MALSRPSVLARCIWALAARTMQVRACSPAHAPSALLQASARRQPAASSGSNGAERAPCSYMVGLRQWGWDSRAAGCIDACLCVYATAAGPARGTARSCILPSTRRDKRIGYRVAFSTLNQAGQTDTYIVFASGWLRHDQSAWGRPAAWASRPTAPFSSQMMLLALSFASRASVIRRRRLRPRCPLPFLPLLPRFPRRPCLRLLHPRCLSQTGH